MEPSSTGLVDFEVFKNLQDKIEDDQKSREEIKDVVQSLEKNVKIAITSLSNAHASPNGDVTAVAKRVEITTMQEVRASVMTLQLTASKYPYYKYNQLWTRDMQDVVFAIALCGWLGGCGMKQEGRLLTIEDVGKILAVPVNLTEQDVFHLTIEEYLHGLISLIDELARLARNSVTLGNYQRPILISHFLKDLQAGFQILNLKNDALRKRSDSIKYKVREVEDVVYDLSLRNLLAAS